MIVEDKEKNEKQSTEDPEESEVTSVEDVSKDEESAKKEKIIKNDESLDADNIIIGEPYKFIFNADQYKKYVLMNCNLYMNYMVFHNIIVQTDTKRHLYNDYEWLPIIFEKAAKLELLEYFSNMEQSILVEIIGELCNITGGSVDAEVFIGIRQIDFGISAENFEEYNLVFISPDDLIDYAYERIDYCVEEYLDYYGSSQRNM